VWIGAHTPRLVAALCSVLVAIVVTSCVRQTNTPRDPDAVTVSMSGDPPTLNAFVSNNYHTQELTQLWAGFLFRADPQGRLIPEAAEYIPTRENGGISRDGRTINYTVRRALRWQDGMPFSVDDVVFSFRAVQDARTNVPDRTIYDTIDQVTVVGPRTVAVHMRAPSSQALYTFFAVTANNPYPLLPAHLLRGRSLNASSFDSAPVGLGPYRVVKWVRGSNIRFAASHSYFRGRPRIERLTVMIVPEQSSLLGLWANQDVDVVTGSTPAVLQAFKSRHDARVIVKDVNQQDILVLNLRGTLRDPALRRALAWSINRSVLVSRVYGALGRSSDGDRLPAAFAYDQTLQQLPYDPRRAATALDRAGWRSKSGSRHRSRTLHLTLAGPTSSLRLMTLLQAQLSEIGINVNIRAYDYSRLIAPANAGGVLALGHFDIAVVGWGYGGIRDHSYLFRCSTQPPNGPNYGGICDSTIDSEARTELETTAPEIEAQSDRHITRRVVNNVWVIFLAFSRDVIVTRNGLAGLKPSSLGMHWSNAYEWRWK
jgi:peptide/nickel transport system substrate-binding protein